MPGSSGAKASHSFIYGQSPVFQGSPVIQMFYSIGGITVTGGLPHRGYFSGVRGRVDQPAAFSRTPTLGEHRNDVLP